MRTPSKQTQNRGLSHGPVPALGIIVFFALNVFGADKDSGKEGGETWWSLKPLTKPEAPRIEGKFRNWPRTPIDQFILKKLLEKGFHPSAPADKRALLRRVYFDLIGLPPTPEEVEGFLRDNSPAAYSKVVDRLLD